MIRAIILKYVKYLENRVKWTKNWSGMRGNPEVLRVLKAMWVHMETGRESGKKAWKNTVYSVNTNSSTWLRQKGKRKALG